MDARWVETVNQLALGLTSSLWRATWQGAILAGAVWIACLLFKKLPFSVKCALWWLVCLKMLMASPPRS